jgi:hypothetical protein
MVIASKLLDTVAMDELVRQDAKMDMDGGYSGKMRGLE